jgi:tetratricopeptide (TPR) repeat protein
VKTGELPADTVESRTTARGAVVLVGAALIVLFILISLLSSAYHGTRRSRAEDRYKAGVRLADAGKNAQAAEDFRAALIYEHDDPKYRFALAKALVSLGQWEEADNYLRELEQRDPTNGPINQMLARLAIRAGKYTEAIDDYNRAIYGYWPQNPDENRVATRLELIQLLDQQGTQRQVLAELLALAGEVPDNDLATRREVAAMLLAHHSPQHAAETYRGILATHPHDAASEQGLGEADFEMGAYLAARSAFRAAVRNGANNPALAQRLELTEGILNLDPTLVRLSASQRSQRSKEVLRRALASANACSTPPEDLSASANKILSAKPKRASDDEIDAILSLAQRLWNMRLSACAQKPIGDKALATVMSELERQ